MRGACYAVCLCDGDRSKCTLLLPIYMESKQTKRLKYQCKHKKFDLPPSSTWTHCVILLVVYVFVKCMFVCNCMNVCKNECIYECKSMCVPVSEHVYRCVYMSVRVRVIFIDCVLKITKIC